MSIGGWSDAMVVTSTLDGTAKPRRRDFRIGDVLGPILMFGVFIGLWYFMHSWGLRHIFDKPGFLIPPPHEVWDKAFMNPTLRSAMLNGVKWTAFTALVGLGISIVLGMLLAVFMSQKRWIERSIWPYLVALQAIPILSVVPIIALLFGYGLGSRILVAVIISIFPIVSNTLFGLLSADTGQHDLFSLRGVSRVTRLLKLQLPAALPAIFTGFRIAAGLSVIGAVVGEQFFRRGGRKGIGMLLVEYLSRTNYAPVYGSLILACLLGIVVFILFGFIGKVAVGRWHEDVRGSS